MKQSVVTNALVRYIDTGTGPVVLLLHGWGTSAAHMGPLITDLSKDYRVVAPDLPGFGGTEPPSGPWTVYEYAVFVTQLLDKLGIESVHAVVGHSFGGRVSIVLAGRGLLKTERVILIDSAGVRHSTSLRNRVYKAVAKTGKAITRLPGLRRHAQTLRTKLYETAGSEDYVNAGIMKTVFVNVINEDLVVDASKITVPTLLLWGADDKDTPVEDAEVLHWAIEGSELVVIPEAGHFVYLDDTVASMKEIRRFLK